MSRLARTLVTLGTLLLVMAGVTPRAFAEGPSTAPMVVLQEGFESASSTTYTRVPTVANWTNGTIYGMWDRVSWRAHSGLYGLWCDGTNPSASVAKTYSMQSGGRASFTLTQTAELYSSNLAFYYSYPSRGDADGNGFTLLWGPGTPGVTTSYWYSDPGALTAVGAWRAQSYDLTAGNGTLSRSSGVVTFGWFDALEGYNPIRTVGEGPTIDDVTVTGWRYGPPRSFSAAPVTGGAKLAWATPYASVSESVTETRALEYRVFRSPAGAATWTEVAGSPFSATTTTCVDGGAASGGAFDYAIQAWEPGGTRYGMIATATVASPRVTVTAPVSGVTIVGTGATAFAGTATPAAGTTISRVALELSRDTSAGPAEYYNGSAWVSAPATFAPSGTTSWNRSWTPPANEYKQHLYTLKAGVTDSAGISATSTPVSFRIDSWPYAAPVSAVTSPSAGATLVGTGAFTLSGTAASTSGPPVADVRVRIARDDNTYWNGVGWQSGETSVAAAGTGTWTCPFTPIAGEYKAHTYTVTSFARDLHGTPGPSASVTFTVDSVPYTAPSVAISNPASGGVLTGRTPVTFTGTSGAASGLPAPTLGVSVRDDAGLYWTGSGWTSTPTTLTPSGAGAWSIGWTPRADEYKTHLYTLFVSATDAHGLKTTASSAFRIDSTLQSPPAVAVSAPVSGATVVSTTGTTLAGSATPVAGTSISRVALELSRDTAAGPAEYFDGSAWSSAPATFAPSGTTSWTRAWTPPADEYKTHLYTLKAAATDERGFSATSTPVSFWVDTWPYTAPTSAVTSPSAGATLVGTGAFALAGTATSTAGPPVAEVRLRVARDDGTYWNGVGWQPGETSVTALGVSAWACLVTPVPGEYKSHVYTATSFARDLHGTVGASASVTFTVDSVPYTAPSATIAFPTAGSELLGAGPYVLRGATSVAGGLPAATVGLSLLREETGEYWTGAGWTSTPTTVTPSGTSSWSLPWTPPPAENNKPYRLTVSARDAHALVTTASSSFIVDSASQSPPDVSVVWPADGSVVVGAGNATLSGTAVPVAGVSLAGVSVEFTRDSGAGVEYYDGSGGWGPSPTTFTPSGTTSWSFSWQRPVNEFKTVLYGVRAYATDERGLVGTSTVTSFRIDSWPYAAPVSAVTSPSAGATLVGTGAFTLSGTAASTSGPPVADVRVRIARDDNTYWNGVGWQSGETSVAAAGTGTWTCPFTPIAGEYKAHTYTVTSFARDLHGTPGPSASVTFTVDSVPYTAPSVAISNPASGGVLTGRTPVTFTGTSGAASGLPAPTLGVSVRDDAGLYWTGSGWTSTPTTLTPSGAGAWSIGWTPRADEYKTHLYTLFVSATDAHGLKTTASSAFRIDSTLQSPPAVAVSAPVSGATVVSTTGTTLAGSATPVAGTSISRVALELSRDTAAGPAEYFDGSAWSSAPATFAPSGTTSWTRAWTPPADEYKTHLYTLKAAATDERGFSATSTPVSFWVDTTVFAAPTVAIVGGPSQDSTLTQSGATVLSGTAVPSTGLGIASVRLLIARTAAGETTYYNGVGWQSIETSVAATGGSTWSYSWNAPTAEFGTSYSVTAIARDAHGLEGFSPARAFRLDTVWPRVAPAASIASPADGAVIVTRGPIAVGGSADAQAGLPAPVIGVGVSRSRNAATEYWTGSAWVSQPTTVSAGSGGAWSVEVVPAMDDYRGYLYRVAVQAVDAHGEVSAVATRSFRVESVADTSPVVVVSTPGTGQSLSGRPITLAGTAAAPAGLSVVASRIEIRRSDSGLWWNGVTWVDGRTSVAPNGLASWAYTFSPPDESADVNLTIQAFAADERGREGESAVVEAKLAATPPPPPPPVFSAVSVTRSPSKSAVTYKRKKGVAKFTLAATFASAGGPRVAGHLVYLQTSKNGRSWKDAYAVRTDGSGKAAKTFKIKKKSTLYYRWRSPRSEALYVLDAYSPSTKVVVK